MLKIDIEGHEYRALLAARIMLGRHPAIITEYDPAFQQAGSGVEGAAYLDYLYSFGYRMQILHRDGSIESIDGAERADAICAQLGHHIDLLLTA